MFNLKYPLEEPFRLTAPKRYVVNWGTILTFWDFAFSWELTASSSNFVLLRNPLSNAFLRNF